MPSLVTALLENVEHDTHKRQMLPSQLQIFMCYVLTLSLSCHRTVVEDGDAMGLLIEANTLMAYQNIAELPNNLINHLNQHFFR